MSRDDVFTNKVFNLLLFSDVSGVTDEEMRKRIGLRYNKYERLRAQLATYILRVHQEGEKDVKPEGVDSNIPRVPGGVQFTECELHMGSYEPLRKEADGERDWRQHSMWACYFSQLSNAFEEAKGTLREVYNEIYNWSHSKECPAEELSSGLASEESQKACTCGISKLQDKMFTTLKRIGGA